MTATTTHDFEAIERAVMETDRGRWFLTEYARRHRSADTEALLKAIHKLEAAMASQVIPAAGGDVTDELSSMAEALRATEADMRSVRNDLLADRGAVADDKSAFEDVAVRARNLAAGLAATADALHAAALQRDDGGAGSSLDGDLARLGEHRLVQDVLSQRIAKAMGLIAHLQERIRASLPVARSVDRPAPAKEAATGEGLNAVEVSYFEADRELFAAEAASAPSFGPGLAADDPENAPHLAGMLDEVLATMPEEQAPSTLDDSGDQSAPGRRRVVIKRSSPGEPAPDIAAPAASAPPPSSAPHSEGEAGPEAIMKMFSDAARKYAVAPAAEPAAPATVVAAPLEPFTPGPEERRRIVVVRRGSSADTPIPLEDTSAEAAEGAAKN